MVYEVEHSGSGELVFHFANTFEFSDRLREI